MKEFKYIVIVKGSSVDAAHRNCKWVEECKDIHEAYEWKVKYPASLILKPVDIELKEL